MADEADLIMRLTMAVVGDPAGARRSAQQITQAIDDVVNAELASLEAKAAGGMISAESLAAQIAAFREAVQLWHTTPKQQLAAQAQAAALAPGTQRALTVAGTPLTDPALKGRMTQSVGMVDMGDSLARANQGIARFTESVSRMQVESLHAARGMTDALRERANILSVLAKKDGLLAKEYARQQARVTTHTAQIQAAVDMRLASDQAYATALTQSTIAQAQIQAQSQGQLAKSRAYQRALTDSAIAQSQIKAQTTARLANSSEYIRTEAGGRILQERLNANILARLASDNRYATELARSAVAQQQINNRVLQLQVATSTYAEEVARGRNLQAALNNRILRQQIDTGLAGTQAAAKALQAELNAATQTQLVQTTGYAASLATSKAAQEQINVQTAQVLANYPGYVANIAAGQQLQAALNNQVLQTHLAQGSLYVGTIAQGKVLQAQVNNQVLARQIALGLPQVQAEAKALQVQLNVLTQRILATNTAYVNDLAEAKLLQQQVNNQVLARQLTTGYADAQARGKVLQEQLNTQMTRQLVGLGFGRDQAAGAVQNRFLEAQKAAALANPLEAAGMRAADRQEFTATRDISRRRLLDQAYMEAQAEATAAKRLETATARQMLITQAEYIAAVEIEAANALTSAAAKKKAELAALSTPAGAANALIATEAAGITAARQRVQTEFQRVVELRELLGLTQAHQGVVNAEIQEAIEGRNIEATINKVRREKLMLQQRAVHAGLLDQPGGTRAGGLGLAQGFRTTLRYGIASAAVFGVAAGVGSAVKEAAELEKVLNQVERQFISLGGERGPAQFEQFKAAVFDIAELTGQAADEVAKVGFQLQGAFGGDTLRAISETRDAIIATRVTGLELTEVIDAFTALTQNFSDSDLTISQFSDTALQLQENLGVLAKETVSFSADLAPVAAELGFTADELATLGGVAQKYSGRSGSSLAEAYGRILPQIREQGVAIVEVFNSLNDQSLTDTLNEAFGSGDIQQAFNTIIGSYHRLGDAQKGAVVDLLGGRREAQAIIPLLQNGRDVLAEYGRAANAEGKSIEYFNDLQDTLQQRLAVLGEEFRHLIQTLYESGLKDFFADFIDLLSSAIRLIGFLSRGMESFIGVLGPLPELLGPILQGALLLKGARFGAKTIGKIGKPRGGAHLADAGGTLLSVGLLSRLFRGGAGGAATKAAGTAPAIAAGAGGASALAKGFLTKVPNLVSLGAAAALAFYSGIDNANRRAVQKAVNEFGVGGVTEQESEALLGRIGAEGGDRAILGRLRMGESAKDIAEDLGDMAEEAASGFEQFLEALPGEMSRRISIDQGQADLLVEQTAAKFEEGVAAGIARYESDEAAAQDINEEVSYILNRRLGSISTALDELDISEGAQEWLATERDRTWIDDDATLGELRAAVVERFETLGVPFEGLAGEGKAALDALIRTLGEDADAASAISEDAKAEIEDIIDRTKQAVADNKVPALIGELEKESPELTTAAQEFVGRLKTLFERTERDIVRVIEDMQEAQLGIEAALAGYEAGTVGSPDVEAAYQRQIQILRAQASGNPELQTDLANAIREAREFQFSLLEREVQALTGLGDLSGNTDYERINAMYTAALETGNFSIEQRADLVELIVENRRQQQQYLADQMTDEAARDAALAADIPLNETEQAALAAKQLLDNQVLRDAITEFADGNEQGVQELIQAIVDRSYEFNESLSEATTNILLAELDAKREIELVRRRGEALRIRLAQVNARVSAALGQEIENLSGGYDFSGLNESTANAERDAQYYRDQQAIRAAEGVDAEADVPDSVPGTGGMTPFEQAQEERRKAEEWRRAVEEAQRERERAAEEYARAIEEALQAQRELAEAQLDLSLAKIEGDPVKEARHGQKQADIAAKYAQTEAEKISAQADRIRADRTLQQAINDVSNSQIELMIAIANAAGDTIESAELSIQQIKDQIAQAKALGLGEADMNALRGQLVGAEAGLRDATLADRKEYFQYLFDLGKITQGQLVGYLQTLLAIPELTQDQIRDIEREIYNLRKELGQDFQYNLPSNLALPTAYELQRFNQSATDMMPGGYNDNRQISVEVSVATDASPEQIAQAVATAVGDPALHGTAIRRY